MRPVTLISGAAAAAALSATLPSPAKASVLLVMLAQSPVEIAADCIGHPWRCIKNGWSDLQTWGSGPPPPSPPPPAPPPPPPPPPPAAFAASQFAVFFPSGESALSPEALQVVQEAAAHASQAHATHILVSAHADGAEADPAALSGRRGQVVSDALRTAGVGEAAIEVRILGNSQPAVATSDSEPLNRRVTIDVSF